jgi:hypothetical protein
VAARPRHCRTVGHHFQAAIAVRKPTCGKKTKAAAARATYSQGHGTPPPQEVGENQLQAAQGWRHQGHGKGQGCSCDKASRRCRESSSTGIFGSSTMAASLFPPPFPARSPGTMPAAGPRQALPKTVCPARRCRAPGEALPLCWEGGDEGISPLWGGKLASEGISPSRDKVA